MMATAPNQAFDAMLAIKNTFVRPATPENDLALWSEAAVCDRLTGFYQSRLADPAQARQLARMHWSIWRGYLNNLDIPARASRQALLKWLAAARLSREIVDEGDAIVIDEIAEIMLQKFRRAPAQAKTYAKCLVAAAMRAGQARA